MNKITKVILISCTVIVGVFILLVVLSMYSSNRSEKLSKKIDIKVTRLDKEDLLSDVVYTITNTSEKVQKLDSIDIDLEAFKQAELVTIDTERTDEYSSFGIRTFEFRRDIAPSETLEIKFIFKRKDSTTNFIPTDICINTLANCIGRSFDI